MSLATRCPSCQTAFRVVQDQLKVSDGWVRCGRCNEVFNALDSLFDLTRPGSLLAASAPAGASSGVETTAASRSPSPAKSDEAHDVGGAGKPDSADDGGTQVTGATGAAAGSQAETRLPADPDDDTEARLDATGTFDASPPAGSRRPTQEDDVPEFTASDVLDSRFFRSELYEEPTSSMGGFDEAPPAAPTAGTPEPDPLDEIGDAEREAAMEAARERAARARRQREELASGLGGLDELDSPSELDAPPSFIRHADRQRRWQQPRWRLALRSLAAVLAVTLVLQLVAAFGSPLAARWPALTSWLQPLCRVAGCRIEALRRVQDLTIESASFTRPGSDERYELRLLLRNRGAMVVAMPSIELTLVGPREEIVARRTLSPQDFRVPDTLAAGREQALALDLDAQALRAEGLRVAGYRVLAFYP